ncbi:MAG TPA: AraC family transcriptional regulator [Gammaproteobacteria bacterium]|nr:AraC family transcriptional regulator [Gammaproteobacteria bacterium]
MTEPISSAQYFPWDGGAVFVGTAGEFPAHAHQAIQICLLFEGRVRLRTTNDEPWADYDLAIVPSRHSHAMDGAKVHYGATLFVEPETREGRILTERFLQSGIAAVDRRPADAALLELRAAALQRRGQRTIVDRARAVVQSLTEHTEPSISSDERILRAVKYINEHLSAPITLAQVARVAYLSPSRFRHLFAEQTGMRLREYVLWRRFVNVWELRMRGVSLSDAAHAAGFADSAHLARTSRRMFGIPPSLMDLSAAAEPGTLAATSH